jgi:Tol biopolymer transport system component
MVRRMNQVSVISLSILVSMASLTPSAAETLILENASLPSWAPGGSEFVCVSDVGILRVSAAGEVLDTIAENTLAQDVAAPLWHPDGENIIYLRRNTDPEVGEWQVAIHGLVGGGTTTWPTEGLWDDFGISFYADSSEVLFDDVKNQVWAMDIESGYVRPFLTGVDASISPDGAWVVFLSNLDDKDVLVKPIAGELCVNIGKGSFPMWTVDSGHVIYTDDGGDLIISTRDGTSTGPLLTGADFDVAGSHSGTVLAFTRCSAGGCDIWITYLSPVPVESKTWGEIKSRFR